MVDLALKPDIEIELIEPMPLFIIDDQTFIDSDQQNSNELSYMFWGGLHQVSSVKVTPNLTCCPELLEGSVVEIIQGANLKHCGTISGAI